MSLLLAVAVCAAFISPFERSIEAGEAGNYNNNNKTRATNY